MGCRNSKESSVVLVKKEQPKGVEVTLQQHEEQQRHLEEPLLPAHVRSDCGCNFSQRKVGIGDASNSSPTPRRSARRRKRYKRLDNEGEIPRTIMLSDIVAPKAEGIEVIKSFDDYELQHSRKERRRRAWYDEVYGNIYVQKLGVVGSTILHKHSWPKDGRHYDVETRKRPRNHKTATPRIRKRQRTHKLDLKTIRDREAFALNPQWKATRNLLSSGIGPPATITTAPMTDEPTICSSVTSVPVEGGVVLQESKIGCFSSAIEDVVEEETPDNYASAPKEQLSTVQEPTDPPLKDDPDYRKYFKMIKMGTPEGAVRHALMKDGKDPAILDMDAEKSLKSQRIGGDECENDEQAPQSAEKRESVATDESDVPALEDDAKYTKYFNMAKMGVPEGAVRNAMERDGLDPGILDLHHGKNVKTEGVAQSTVEGGGNGPRSLGIDPGKSLKSQTKGGEKDNDDPPLKDDPDHQKYFKMLKMGLPKGAVRQALERDGKDPNIADLDPEKSLKSQLKGDEEGDHDPPLKNDPEHQKYFKMLKMGLPKGAVRQALERDGKDPNIADLDPEKSLKSQMKGGEERDDDPPLKDDEEFQKYFKMLKMDLPKGAVRQALERDGKDPSIADLDPEKSLKSQTNGGEKGDDDPPLKDHEEFQKYFKMLKMGLPKGAVRQALERDGKDPNIADLDPDKSLRFQTEGGEKRDCDPPLKDHEEFQKYFKMLKMGLPKGAVRQALERDGKDPSVVDLDPDKSFRVQTQGKKSKPKASEKKRVRRKKVYWTPIEEENIQEGSLWSLCRGSVVMESLNFDSNEFELLFTESSDCKQKKKKKESSEQKAAAKKSVQVIDGKRGMNGGIILARLKIEYARLAEMVEAMDAGKLDATQLKALKEFLPTDEERTALDCFVKTNGIKAVSDLTECEKYMVAMLGVVKPHSKFDCMLFRCQLANRIDDLESSIVTVREACEQVRSSDKLRKVMATILTVVNYINTGGQGKTAAGFSLDALLKLNEAKAFDKKTSVLEYLVKLVKENDDTLLSFQKDITSIAAAENIQLDSLNSDLKSIRLDLTKAQKTVEADASRRGNDIPSENSDGVAVIDESCDKPSVLAVEEGSQMPMLVFLQGASKKVEGTESSLNDLQNAYTNVLQYFGEDANMPSNEFFGTMHKFSMSFGATVDAVQRKEKAKLKEKLRAAARKVKAARRIASLKKEPSISRTAITEMAPQDDGESPQRSSTQSHDEASASVQGSTKSDSVERGQASTFAAAAVEACLKRKSLAQNVPTQDAVAAEEGTASSTPRDCGEKEDDRNELQSGPSPCPSRKDKQECNSKSSCENKPQTMGRMPEVVHLQSRNEGVRKMLTNEATSAISSLYVKRATARKQEIAITKSIKSGVPQSSLVSSSSKLLAQKSLEAFLSSRQCGHTDRSDSEASIEVQCGAGIHAREEASGNKGPSKSLPVAAVQDSGDSVSNEAIAAIESTLQPVNANKSNDLMDDQVSKPPTVEPSKDMTQNTTNRVDVISEARKNELSDAIASALTDNAEPCRETSKESAEAASNARKCEAKAAASAAIIGVEQFKNSSSQAAASAASRRHNEVAVAINAALAARICETKPQSH